MLNSWKDHKFITFQHELWRPVLAVWMFFKDILMYVFDLFKISWKSLPLAMNKNAIIPSFIASCLTCILGFSVWFIVQILIAKNIVLDISSPDSLILPIVVLLIIVALPMCWGFSTVASVIKAKESGEDDNWKRHSSVGSKGVRFFLTYVLVVLVLLLSIILLSSVYAYLIYYFFNSGYDFFENYNLYLGLYNLAELLENEAFLIIFWVHFLTVNLFCGAWIVNDSNKFYMAKFLVILSLIITYFVGPIGIFIYWVIRIFYAKSINLFN